MLSKLTRHSAIDAIVFSFRICFSVFDDFEDTTHILVQNKKKANEILAIIGLALQLDDLHGIPINYQLT